MKYHAHLLPLASFGFASLFLSLGMGSTSADDSSIRAQLERKWGRTIEVFPTPREMPAPYGHVIFSSPARTGPALKTINEKRMVGAKAKLTTKFGDAFYISDWSWERIPGGHSPNWVWIKPEGAHWPTSKSDKEVITLGVKRVWEINRYLAQRTYLYHGTLDIKNTPDRTRLLFYPDDEDAKINTDGVRLRHKNINHFAWHSGESSRRKPPEGIDWDSRNGAVPFSKMDSVILGVSEAGKVIFLYRSHEWSVIGYRYAPDTAKLQIALAEAKDDKPTFQIARLLYIEPTYTDLIDGFANLMWTPRHGTLLFGNYDVYGDILEGDELGKRSAGIPFANYRKERFQLGHNGWRDPSTCTIPESQFFHPFIKYREDKDRYGFSGSYIDDLGP